MASDLELYVLDDVYFPIAVVEHYESFIWSERFFRKGDFELELLLGSSSISEIKIGTHLGLKQSNRIMTVDRIETGTNDAGKMVHKVTGPSRENILSDRGYVPTYHLENASAGRAVANYGSPNYAVSTSQTVIPASNAWVKVMPEQVGNKFIWVRSGYDFADGAKTRQYDIYKESYPAKRKKTTSTTHWQLGTSGEVIPTGAWVTTRPSHPANRWMWRRVITKYTKGDPVYFYYCYWLGSTSGVPEEPDIEDNIPYLHVAWADDSNGKNFSLTDPSQKAYVGSYRDYTAADSPGYSDYTWTQLDNKEEYIQDSLTGYAQDILYTLWDEIVVNGTYTEADKIPELIPFSPYPPGSIPWPDRRIAVKLSATDLLSIFEDICEATNIGFRLVVNKFSSHKLHFEVYSGNDLTSEQFDRPPVIFSPKLDNLAGVREISSAEEHKNVVCLTSPEGTAYVYAPNVDTSVEGFQRRVLMMDVSSTTLDKDETFPTEEMVTAALAELEKYKSTYELDGEIPKNSEFIYGEDYELGDIVEMRNSQGSKNRMRVTEQIFVSDGEGMRSYPTLTTIETVMPGSWSSFEWNVEWEDAEGHWGDV